MKLGLSTYSLDRDIAGGKLTLPDSVDFAARNGAECLELVPLAFRFDDPQTCAIDHAFTAQVKRRAQDAGVELVNYSVPANLLKDGQAQEDEIKRVCHEVDIAAELGVPQMRHDIASSRRPPEQNGLADFDVLLPKMIQAAQRISEYARGKGVKTLIENHGFFVNGCDRVERLLNGVGSDNYGLLLDTGNFVCVDEDPAAATALLAYRCRMVHLKDFYVRRNDPGDSTQLHRGGHWFRSRGGKYLRGAILGHGDLDVHAALRALKNVGYTGNIIVEFEGIEDAQYASAVSMQNARRIWDEV